MNRLAKKIGRADAYATVKKALKHAASTDNLRAVIEASTAIKKHLNQDEIEDLLTPQNYLGSSSKIVERTVKRVRETWR